MHTPRGDEVFVLPTSVAQQSFWYLDQVEPGNPAQNIAVRLRWRGPIRYEGLERALGEIVARHESLRTAFDAEDGLPVQVVAQPYPVRVPVVDLRGVPEGRRPSRSDALSREEARRRFDLSSGPLFRARLLRLDDHDHILLLTVHHIVSDGWSIGVITRELGALYDASCRGLDSPLPGLPLQYADYAVWQNRRLEGRDVAAQLTYWTRRLADLPVLRFPTDRPRPAVRTHRGDIESVLLPRDLTETLVGLANREKATFFMLALAALYTLLRRLTKQDDIVVGTLTAGRHRVELEPLIGPFINPLVLRTDLSGDPPFLELVARVEETVLDAFANQEVPFERVVQAVQPRRDPNRHPLFQINFIYQRDFVEPLTLLESTVTPIPSVSPGAVFDLNFFMVERKDGWRASCEYDTDLFDPASVRRMLAQFQALLEGVAADPTRRVSEIPMLTAADREPPVPAPGGPSRPTGREPGPPADSTRAYVAPRDETEARLAKLWEQVLGVDRISVTADFFDEGGHSLLAARLRAQIERAFGKKISLATILQAPTVEKFAERLRRESSTARHEQVLPIQPEGFLPPFVVVTSQPPLYRALAQRLGPDQPVLCLTPPEVSALPERFTVRDVAANLVEALREAQPHGPYYLSGWCVSGVIAYEMAQQLRGRGEEVALLVLFDSNSPVYLRSFKGVGGYPKLAYFRAKRLWHQVKTLVRMRPGRALKDAGARIRAKLRSWVHSRLELLSHRVGPFPGDELIRFLKLQNLAVARYDPEPYGGPVVLFRSAFLQTGRFTDPQMGWGAVARGGLDVHEIPGDHKDMFVEPTVELLAEKLAGCLSQAEGAEAAGMTRSVARW